MSRNLMVAHLTDPGLKRKDNQDSCGCWRDANSGDHLLLVADGMGGAACGREASDVAINSIRDKFFDPALQQISISERLKLAFHAAHLSIRERVAINPECDGMGTTCVAAAISGKHAFLAHIGDSRIYLSRGQRITRLTKDHSLVQRMFDDGLIEEHEIASHPQRNVLQRALGPRDEVEPEIKQEPLELLSGDVLLLCTDGLCGQVHDEEIFEIISKVEPMEACESLINLANWRGGPDNITVAVCKVESD
jgi:protein phosphatase